MTDSLKQREVWWIKAYNILSKTVVLDSMRTIYLLELGHSFLAVSFMVSLTYATRLLFAIPAGIAADRWDKRYLLISGNLLKALGFLFLFLGKDVFIYSSAVVLATGFMIIDVAENSFYHDYCEEEGKNFAKFRGNLKSEQIIYRTIANYGLSFLYMVVGRWVFAIPPVFIAASTGALLASKINPKSNREIKDVGEIVKSGVSGLSKDHKLRNNLIMGAILIAITISLAKINPINMNIRGITGGMVGIIDNSTNLLVILFLKRAEVCGHPKFERFAIAALAGTLLVNAFIDGYMGLLIVIAVPIIQNLYVIYSGDIISIQAGPQIKTSMLSIRELMTSALVILLAPIIGFITENYGVQTLSLIFAIGLIAFIIFPKQTKNLRLTEDKI